MKQPLVLASESPRRKELLMQAGIPFTVCVAHAAEINDGTPEEVVCHNATVKAMAVREQFPDHCVLGADTIVCLEGRIFGKPKDSGDAVRMLNELNARWHQVYTGVAVVDETGQAHTAVAVTNVHFVQMTDAEIADYVATGEPLDKAGAYAIQGRAGYYIDRIEGSSSNVIGLPLATVRQLLNEL